MAINSPQNTFLKSNTVPYLASTFVRYDKKYQNAKCHAAENLKHIRECPHPPDSWFLAIWDFWIFPKVKMTRRGKHLEWITHIEAATKKDIH